MAEISFFENESFCNAVEEHWDGNCMMAGHADDRMMPPEFRWDFVYELFTDPRIVNAVLGDEG